MCIRDSSQPGKSVAKSPAKVSVECSHCGFKQMEYAAAKSTICRQCGKHFMVAATERPETIAGGGLNPASLVSGGASAAQALLHRVEGLWNRSRILEVSCFDCGTKQ